MRLHEHQAKKVFKDFGISTPEGKVVNDPDDAEKIAEEINSPVVVKAQIQVGSRGKAGGIKFAEDPKDARKKAKEILGKKISGIKVKKVLVEEALNIEKEYYVGFTLDRGSGKPVAIISSRGGVDIEEVAEKTPESIAKEELDPIWPLHDFKARKLAFKGNIRKEAIQEVSRIAQTLYKIFTDKDATLAEINPLVLTEQNQLLAADAVLNIDNNALFKQPELAELREETEEDPLIRKAHEYGFDYVRLDGNVGVVGNGAGLVMTTLDLIDYFGGKPANFLDVGGGAGSATVENALDLVFQDPNVDVVLFNIFGGITKCDEVARGINEAIEGRELPVPLLVRLAGTNYKEGLKVLNDEKLRVVSDLEDAVKEVVKLAGE
ncbi:succinyl-CoA synthetase subunit beta [candidate division MSBL1 archaeon SCGC-AAA259E22]|uniref:Succinate--CoA ligase [ADP-forming] subunit beta n=2 Tax=candidate division MSBL1 TaxID=215777 RepID=A0A133U7W1_9EURY|nr:succinyl-CoA synthetase subunit beta [candidate division MSBL1 archaeon SCGC-AAA259B11]KXA93415.1 succinyl-CoA synthetase subunit beta [candidate division MSBL1 archaeon SCGC-AAA259E22]